MARSLFLCLAAGLVAAASGCAMCASPYDECGPTVTGNCFDRCGSTARAGSVLSMAGTPVSDSAELPPGLPVSELPEVTSAPLPTPDRAYPTTITPKSGGGWKPSSGRGTPLPPPPDPTDSPR